MNPRQLFSFSAYLFLPLLLVLAGCATRTDRAPVMITGRVVDVLGNPIAGCTVTPVAMETRGWDRVAAAYTSSRTWSPRALSPTQTDADGRFTCASCDWRIKEAYSSITLAKDGFVSRTQKVYAHNRGEDRLNTLLPSCDSLLAAQSSPKGRALLLGMLKSPRMELARNYFPSLPRFRPHLLSVITDSSDQPALAAAAQEAGFMLALLGDDRDRDTIGEWARRERKQCGFLEVVSLNPTGTPASAFPTRTSGIQISGEQPWFEVFEWDQAATTSDSNLRLYLGQWVYTDPLGIHVEMGDYLAVIRRTDAGCKATFVSTVWLKRNERYFGTAK